MASKNEVADLTAEVEKLGLTDNEPIWDVLNVKLAFVNADDGKHENFTRLLCEELLIDPELTVVAVLENGWKTKQREISTAIGRDNYLHHWRCGERECRRVGKDERDGITIIYNSNQIQEVPVVDSSPHGRYIYLRGNFINPHGNPLSIDITAVHLNIRADEREEAYNDVRARWATAKNSELAVIMGDFNESIANVHRHGIDGDPAFEPGYLTTNALIKPRNIDNSYSNRLFAERDLRIWDDFDHKIGIVTYSIEKMRIE